MSKFDKVCSVCGKEFSLFFYDAKGYSYKVRKECKYVYQCSYPCYCKELDNGHNTKNTDLQRSE